MIDLPQGDYVYKGTILKQNRDSEALLVFLMDIGKTWIFVQGKGRNRFLGATEPMIWGEFNTYKNSHGLFLKNVNIKNDFLSLRQSATSLFLATKIYGVVADKLPFELKNNSLLRSLYDTLVLIDEGASGEATNFRFIAKFLSSYGIMPSFHVCTDCGSAIHDVAHLSSRGIFCGKCASPGDLHLELNDLIDVHKALCLDHNDFVSWCKSANYTNKLGKCSKILENYFDRMK